MSATCATLNAEEFTRAAAAVADAAASMDPDKRAMFIEIVREHVAAFRDAQASGHIAQTVLRAAGLPEEFVVTNRMPDITVDTLKAWGREADARIRTRESITNSFVPTIHPHWIGEDWLPKGTIVGVISKPSVGKAQPVTTPVLTPGGWRSIGSLLPGDQVIGSDGRPTEVLGVFPQGVRPVFRVSMSDGTATTTCAEHLWTITDSNGKKKTLSTAEIEQRISMGGNRQHTLPLVAPVQHPEADLPVDPYLLGLLLGDGGLAGTTPKFSSVDAEIHEAVAELIPAGLSANVVPTDPITVRLAGRQGMKNPLTASLRSLGCDTLSLDKHIPRTYLHGSVEQRLALLQGLMDTDGTVGKDNGCVQFGTSSERLAADFAELVRSLGGIALTSTKNPSYTHNGKRRAGALHYRISVMMDLPPFRLQRKLDKMLTRQRHSRRRITEIIPSGEAECVCILVAADDHLYVTENHIVTHNTIFLVDMACRLAYGLRWQGCRVEQTPTLYLAFEAAPSVRNRVAAWGLDREKADLIAEVEAERPDLIDREGVIATPSSLWVADMAGVNLRHDGGRKEILSHMERVKAATGSYPGAIIIDTLAQAFGAGSEDTESMAEFVIQMQTLIVEHPDLTIIVAHHTRKDVNEGEHSEGRGSGVLRGAASVEMSLAKMMVDSADGPIATNVINVKRTKARDGEADIIVRGIKRMIPLCDPDASPLVEDGRTKEAVTWGEPTAEEMMVEMTSHIAAVDDKSDVVRVDVDRAAGLVLDDLGWMSGLPPKNGFSKTAILKKWEETRTIRAGHDTVKPIVAEVRERRVAQMQADYEADLAEAEGVD